jgi:hypothetical protein
VANSGDTADYILTDIGENVLAEGLRKELDNKVSTAIEKPSELLEVIGTEKFLEFVKEAGITTGGISFPELLALSCLYTKWEYVFSWNSNLGYLFSWEYVPGEDSERLLRFLKDDLDIVWADRETAEISKINDVKTIRISNKHEREKYAEITLDEKEEKATLKIRDGETCNLKVKNEDGKLNIHNSGINKKELRKFLSEDIGIYWTENNGILENLDEKTLYIPKDENNPVERIY